MIVMVLCPEKTVVVDDTRGFATWLFADAEDYAGVAAEMNPDCIVTMIEENR